MKKYNNRIVLLYVLAAASPLAFGVWMVLLNNFVVEVAHFNGEHIGFLQSIREIPGLLSFTVVFWLLLFKQQVATYLFLILLGVGVFLTGLFPSTIGLYITTIVMSFGFHYGEILYSSLSLQWLKKGEAPAILGKQISLRAFISIFVMLIIFLLIKVYHVEYKYIYMIFGGLSIALVLFAWIFFDQFENFEIQEKKLFLRKKYQLYYLLTFLAGARRQIFVVFAAFLLVKKFGFSIDKMIMIYLVNKIISMISAPIVGKLVARFGEKLSLRIEYISLMIIFTLYGIVKDPNIAILLFIFDHILFSMAIALKTYFQKIADPKDITATAGVSFAINHIAAIFLPAILGLLWLKSYSLVFFIGTFIVFLSFVLTFFMPNELSKYSIQQ